MKHCLIAALCLASGPALAWTETKDFRGLHVYEASGEGVALSVVCDPDGAMIPPENHLMMTVQGENYSGDYQLKSSERSFEGQIQNGTLVSTDGDPWNEVIAVLRSSSEIDLSINGMSYALNTEQPFPVECGSSAE